METKPTYEELEQEIKELEEEAVKSKQTEETLRETEERFRSIYEESPVGIEIYDSKGQLLHANKACLDIFGVVDERQIKGFRLFDDPNLPDKEKSKLRKGQIVRYEATFDFDLVKKNDLYDTTKSGIAHLDVVITPLASRGNEGSGEYLVQVQDNTERKQAEEALQSEIIATPIRDKEGNVVAALELVVPITERKKVEETLQREQDFISAVLSTAGALVIVLDSDGRIVRFNRACEQLTSYLFEEVQGKHFWDLFLIPEEVEPVKTVFAELRSGNFPNEYENYWVTKNGSRHLIMWSNTVLLDREGSIEYVIGTGLILPREGRLKRHYKRHTTNLKKELNNVPLN
jgi:PAS domain S-box-containing protein